MEVEAEACGGGHATEVRGQEDPGRGTALKDQAQVVREGRVDEPGRGEGRELLEEGLRGQDVEEGAEWAALADAAGDGEAGPVVTRKGDAASLVGVKGLDERQEGWWEAESP